MMYLHLQITEKWLINALFVTAVLFAAMNVHAQNGMQQSVETLKSLLAKGEIKKIRILRVPDGVMTRTPVTPEGLRAIASYELVLNQGFAATFSSLLSAEFTQRTNQTSDLRWGVLFYDSSGQEVASVFVDKFGQNGYVDKEPAQFGSNLATRLRQVIQELR